MRGWLLGVLLCLSLPLCSAERVVSLAPFLTDMLVLLEADARLVGVIDDPSLPESLGAVPRIGAYQSLSLERIVAARPDLVLAWTSGNPPELLSRLEALGIKVLRFDPQRLADIQPMTLELGRTLERADTARTLSARFATALQALRAPDDAPRVRVFLQVWDEPMFTVAGEQLLSDALEHCGAVNSFAALPGLSPQVSTEAVMASQPEMIIAVAADEATGTRWLRRWEAFPAIPAVRDAQLWTLESDSLVRPTPRIVEGMRRLCMLIQSRPVLKSPASS